MTSTPRPPIVVVMGHIDHGKSTLLDFIRKTNVVASESGGITQHLSAYEVTHKTKEGDERKITFLDTPGHAAFSAMRARGARVADVAILVVAADDGVKAQTVEAITAIKEAKIPFIVAINKIDKPGANTEKAKSDLLEHGVYVEGYGGDIPFALVSAKTGEGIPDLLDVLLLVSDLGSPTANSNGPAEGLVIESHVDPKKGVSATLIITNGTLVKGSCIAAGDAFSPVRGIEDSFGRSVESATFSSPIRITGFNKVPIVGETFIACDSKKEAEEKVRIFSPKDPKASTQGIPQTEIVIPIIIRADAVGTLDAILLEAKKVEHEKVSLKVVNKGVGAISENDIKLLIASERPLALGFRVPIEKQAVQTGEQYGIPIKTFDVIYDMADFLKAEIASRIPKEEIEETGAVLKVLKTFSKTRDKQVIGGKLLSGNMRSGSQIKLLRRDAEIARGRIIELQQQKIKVGEVKEGGELGALVECRMEIVPGDTIETFSIVIK